MSSPSEPVPASRELDAGVLLALGFRKGTTEYGLTAWFHPRHPGPGKKFYYHLLTPDKTIGGSVRYRHGENAALRDPRAQVH